MIPVTRLIEKSGPGMKTAVSEILQECGTVLSKYAQTESRVHARSLTLFSPSQ